MRLKKPRKVKNNRRMDRNISNWPGDRFEYKDFDDFLRIDRIETGLHSICDGQEIIDFYYKNNESDRLAVIFHGAVQAQKIARLALPIFAGLKIPLGMEVDRLLFSDATMATHRELRLGWFSGTESYDFAQRIDQILAKVTSIKIFNRVLLLGGSQGGFAALRASHRLDNSVALVWNPQTRVQDFFIKSHLSGFLQYCFGVENYDQLSDEIKSQRNFDLPDMYGRNRANNFVFLMQNFEDIDHLEDHAKPLAAAMGYDLENIALGINRVGVNAILAVGDWAGGHSLPDRATLEQMAHVILASELSTEDLFNRTDFASLLPASFMSNRNQPQQPVLNTGNTDSKTRKHSALTSRERGFMLEIMKQSPRNWYLQYGMSNILLAAAEMGFRQINAIDANTERASLFKRNVDPIVRQTGAIAYMLHADIGALDPTGWPSDPASARRWPNYILKPWKWPPPEAATPDIIFINGPFTVPTAMHVAMRSCLWHDGGNSKLFVLDIGEGSRAFEILSEHFTVESRCERLMELKLRPSLDAQVVMNDFITYIISLN